MKPMARSRKHGSRQKYNDFIYFYFYKTEHPSKMYCPNERQPCRLRYMCGLRRNDFSDGSQRNSDVLPEVGIVPCIGEPASHENSIFVKEVGTHSYREDFSTSLGIWVYGDIRLSARDMAPPNE
jgi:hypothetical protein